MFRVRLYRHLLLLVPRQQNHHSNLCNVNIVIPNHHHHSYLKSVSGFSEYSSSSSSTTSAQITRSRTFTEEYLINSCGLSPEKAYSAGKRVDIYSAEEADSVIYLLEKQYGFTKTQITTLIFNQPNLLSPPPFRNELIPNLDYFFSELELVVSRSEAADLIASNPHFLLQYESIPVYNSLKSYIFDGHDDATISMINLLKRWPKKMTSNAVEVLVMPSIAALTSNGVPDCNVRKMFLSNPTTLKVHHHRVKEIIKYLVKETGADPSTPKFLLAFRTMAGINQFRWEDKLAVFERFGWSENDIVSMLKNNPGCMAASELKIRRVLKFFMDEYKWKPEELSLHPWLFRLSLEKRVRPRCQLFDILKSEGIISESRLKVTTFLKVSKKDFMDKYVTKYQEQVPQVMEEYKLMWA